MVYYSRRFVLNLAWCYFVPVFFSFSIAITSLGEERVNLSAFRTFVRFALVWFCLFSLPLGVWEGLWLVIVALYELFSHPFFVIVALYGLLFSPFLQTDRHKTVRGVKETMYILLEDAIQCTTNHGNRISCPPRFSLKRRGTNKTILDGFSYFVLVIPRYVFVLKA